MGIFNCQYWYSSCGHWIAGLHSRWRFKLLEFDGLEQGLRLLRRFPPFRYFPTFSTSPKYMLAIEYHFHIWQVSPQLRCGDTCQIWMWFEESNMYFCHVENFAYGEFNERSFSNPHPRTMMTAVHRQWSYQSCTKPLIWCLFYCSCYLPACNVVGYELYISLKCSQRIARWVVR